jgi:hypothetical protein
MIRPSSLHHRDQAVLDQIHRHPVAHNLLWKDVLRLVGHLGKAEQKHDSKWLFEVEGLQRTFPSPHGDHMEPGEVAKLREFLNEAGCGTKDGDQPQLGANRAIPVKMVLIDHHEASVYDLRDSACTHVATVRPHDPHHFLHHLTHRDQSRSQGQRASEDPAFYDTLISALQGADVAVLIGTATGSSAALEVLGGWLRAEHGRAPPQIIEITHANISAYTVPELAKLAREALRERLRGANPQARP